MLYETDASAADFAKADLSGAKLQKSRLIRAKLDGAKLRLRPILMTSFAFILGCVPLWLATGSGAASRRILGTVVVSGMLTATLIAMATVWEIMLHPSVGLINVLLDGLGLPKQNWLKNPDLALFATCCFVVVNPGKHELAICRAGHPPALVLPPGGKPRVLDCDAGLPLGIDVNAEYRTTQLQVEPGSVLVLTTDGLMVADSADAHNLSSLLAVLRLATADDLEVLADDLLSLPRRQTRHGDDVALLLARVDAGTSHRARA